MNLYWTSKAYIHGLRHFVLVNNFNEKEEIFFELVSVLDPEINLIISKKDLENSKEWQYGWIDFKEENIDFKKYKSFKKEMEFKEKRKISLNDGSPFNIS